MTRKATTTTTRAGRTRRPQARPDLNAAIKDLLKAIPIDHLDRRLTALEKWIAGIQKDLTRALAGPRRRPAHRTHTRHSVSTRRYAQRPR